MPLVVVPVEIFGSQELAYAISHAHAQPSYSTAYIKNAILVYSEYIILAMKREAEFAQSHMNA